MYYKQKQVGFTLLEMIVVVAIFSLVVVVISSILNSVFLSRKVTVARERLQSDSNSIIEIISKNVRNSQPNYAYYENIPLDLTVPVEVLSLIDKDKNQIAFRKSSGEGDCGTNQNACLVLGVGSSPNWTNITPLGVELVDIKFYIEPAQNPFVKDPAGRLDKQPLVTVVLKTEAVVGSNQGNVSNIIQTSVSSRFYQERCYSNCS